jgi:hypothetical protein
MQPGRGRTLLLAVGLLLAPCSASRAVIATGYDLYWECTVAGSDIDAAAYHLDCTGYLSGYLGGLFEAKKLSNSPTLAIGACPSGDVVIGQYQLVFKNWAERNPKWLSRPAPDALAASLIEAFPCQMR